MGQSVHCESFLPLMRDLSEDSNSCSWSMYCGDKNLPYGQYQNGFSMRAAANSYSGYERDFLKQTMLEHEIVFKNQVYELHRLYRTQKSLMDEIRGKSMIEHGNQSEHTPENAIKRELPGFLLGNTICGEGSSSQACNVSMQNGCSSKEEEVLEVRPVKLRRKMIDLQLPADEYLDTDSDTNVMSHSQYEQSKAGKEVGVEMFREGGNASHRNDSSGSCLSMKNRNGLTDLNEPAQCQESIIVPFSRDIYSPYGRNIEHVQDQRLEKNTSQNEWASLEAGHEKSTPRDKLCLPSHSAQILSNNLLQPLGYSSTDNRKVKFPSDKSALEWEARTRNPEVSYDSYVESSVASNAPSLHHAYRPESVRPWSHWISSWENRSGIPVQKSFPVQPNPFLNFNTQAKADSSSEMRSRDFDRLYQGFSSGSKETVFNFPSGNSNHLNGPKEAITKGSLSEVLKHRSLENLQGPKKQECSAGLPWIKPKPTHKSEITNGCLDLNASANQFMDGTDACDGLTGVSPRNGLLSVSCSNGANVGQVEMADSRSSRKILGFPIFQKNFLSKEEHTSLVPSSVCITDQPKELSTLMTRNLDINLPCEASVSFVDQHCAEAAFVNKKEGKNAATFRHCIDLNLCASEDEDSSLCSNRRVETRATTLIDLEAPATLESEEEEEKLPEKRDVETQGSAGESIDELIKAAAEAIVTISLSHHIDEAASSSTDAVVKDPLSWFANTIASCGNDLEEKIKAYAEARDCEGFRDECSSDEFDYFEAMTLNLPHTKEEDYMPQPLVPESLKLDGTGSIGVTANRPRRGQARRGRPKRDFQRDILPGLSCLSKLEVTEDLQMFGGLMKATGCTWNSGVARRNSNRGGGSGRGRKRLVTNIIKAPVYPSLAQPINNNNNVQQMVGLEDRSLTGWGNATRRPRRQRCPAGTPPTVILT